MKFTPKIIFAALTGCTIHSATVSACDANPLIAEVCPVAFNFAPQGWAFTNGQLMAISENSPLFSLVGTMYGGDGRTTFGLPDTRSRVVIGTGQGPGLSNYREGDRGGLETVTLTVQQMPSHTHVAATSVNATTAISASAQINVATSAANQGNPTGNVLAVAPGTNNMYRSYDNNIPQATMHAGSIDYGLPGPFNIAANATTTVSIQGGSFPHENRMPTLALNWVIALYGVYPSRN